MKVFALLIVFTTSIAFAAVDVKKPIAELTLRDGRTLKNVVFVSYSSTAIMAKWEGGRGTIAYDALPADVGEAVKTMRPKPNKAPASAPRPAAPSKREPQTVETKNDLTPAKVRTLTGQVFVTTRGAGSYRFTGAQVLAFPYSIFEEVQRAQRVLGPPPVYDDGTMPRHVDAWIKALNGHMPCGSATTDAEGKYSMQVNGEGDVFLFCTTTRLAGRKQEYNLWVVKSIGAGSVNLDGSNSLF